MNKITIHLTGYVSAVDPGIVHTSTSEGSIDMADVTPGMNLNTLLEDWWRSDVAGKIAPFYFVEQREDGALFRYGERVFLVEFGNSRRVDEVGLSYAYGGLYVSLKKE